MMSMLKKFRRSIKQNDTLEYLFSPFIRIARIICYPKKRMFENWYESILPVIEEGSLVIRVPGHQGNYEMDIRSHLLKRILRDKEYEPDLVELVKKHIDRQRDVLDIGANIGLYTIFFAKLINPGKKVLAVEPTPLALKYLQRNLQRNSVENAVIIFKGVATNTQGKYQIHIVAGMEEYSSLGEMTHPAIQGKPCNTIEVNGDTIDHLVQRYDLKPGFLKIDAEGAEYLVLSGAMKTLQQYKPVLLFECSEELLANCDSSSEQVVNLLHTIGYDVFDANDLNAPIKFPFYGELVARAQGEAQLTTAMPCPTEDDI